MKKMIVLCLLLVTLIGCQPKDPSVYDIKSPCASSKKEYTNGHEPCIKRSPLGNKLV
jgi:hypothetical protein